MEDQLFICCQRLASDFLAYQVYMFNRPNERPAILNFLRKQDAVQFWCDFIGWHPTFYISGFLKSPYIDKKVKDEYRGQIMNILKEYSENDRKAN